MKGLKGFVSVGILAAFFTSPARAAVRLDQPPPTIMVSGSAEVKVVPDEVNLDIGIESRAATLDEATNDNNQKVAAVQSFLKGAGIDAKDVQTDFISVRPEYNEPQRRTPNIYVAERRLGIRLRKLADFEKVLLGVMKRGANHVNGIEFRTTELRKHRDAARLMAVRAAREKAQALAGELGAKVGKVQSISENTWGGWNNWGGGMRSRVQNMSQNAMQVAGDGGGAGESGLAVGQITVSATVNVSFLLD